jgi:hypothetical protein
VRQRFDTVSTILDDNGILAVNDRKITLGAMGHFGHRYDESSRAYKRGAKMLPNNISIKNEDSVAHMNVRI